jgi:DnaJ family protein C protein 19
MILVALGVLGLAVLVAVGRRPLMARAPGRFIAIGLAVLATAAAAYDAARGGWLGGSILMSAALWLALSARGPRRIASDGMSRAQAAAMLGVPETAARDEIEAAYRRLMFRVHPDQGGAAGLAAQLNAARAVLLGPGR